MSFLNKRKNGYWYAHYRDEDGRWKSLSTRAKTKSEASKFFSNLKSNIEQSKKKPSQPLTAFIQQYLEYSEINHAANTTDRIRVVLEHFLEFIGETMMDRITPQMIEEYKIYRVKNIISPVTVNIELRSLKAFFNTALKWEVIERNPFNKVNFMRLPEEKPEYFNNAQVKALIGVMESRWLRDMTLLSLNTGMRRAELVNLRWTDIDFTKMILSVRNSDTFKTKSRKERAIPLNTLAIGILKGQPPRSDYVFSKANGTQYTKSYVSQIFKEAVRKANLDDRYSFHSLRHTFATNLLKSGVGVVEVQRLLGHSNISVTMGYSHIVSAELTDAVNRIVVDMN